MPQLLGKYLFTDILKWPVVLCRLQEHACVARGVPQARLQEMV
jgi:hypothetical protein